MQRLISSLATVFLLFLPTTAVAQHRFGGEYYRQPIQQQQQARDYLILQFRNGRSVVRFPVSGSLHEVVAEQNGIARCEQTWTEITPPAGFGYAAVITQGFCSNGQNLNHYPPNYNPGYGYNQPWNGGGGGGCLYKQWNRNSGFQVGNC
jgi:hypothetical protein